MRDETDGQRQELEARQVGVSFPRPARAFEYDAIETFSSEAHMVTKCREENGPRFVLCQRAFSRS